MDKNVVFIKVKDRLAETFNLEPDSILPEKRLDNDFELDSLDMVDFVMTLNDEDGLLNEKIEPVIFREARTVQDLVDILLPHFSTE